MATYNYTVPNVDFGKLLEECQAAGLPVTDVKGGAIGSTDVTVETSFDLTPLQKTTLDNVVAAHDGRMRRPRPIIELDAAVNALTTTQKTALNNDLYGPTNKWAASTGGNDASLFVLYLITQLGLSAAQTTRAKIAGAAMYCQDNPKYLVNPPFAPTVNIPGDEAAT